jgi:ribosome-binding ATPase YchF (GTP1/OBG family)
MTYSSRRMDVGIVGLANSGRTTVFRALLAHRAPRASGDRHASAIGTIHVQDPRLERLAELFKPKKTTPVEIRIHDCCGSLETSFPTAEIEALKRMDLLLGVLPAYGDGSPAAAVAALEQLLAELCLEDLAAVERRLSRHPREKLEPTELDALGAARDALEAEVPVHAAPLSDPARAALRGYALITDRPFIAVLNTAEAQAGDPPPEDLVKRASDHGIPVLALCAALEAEMADLGAEERAEFLAEYSVSEPAGAAVTRAILDRADLVPFYTVGDDECRAWPVTRGTAARTAAGKIHSDIERGFIRAEVIGFEELEALPGLMADARKLGLLRLEGKDYVVQDGEIVHFRFNV